MDNVLLLDTSIGSLNKGDDIIMECVRQELSPLLSNNYELTLTTHTSPFHWYQVFRNSVRVQIYDNCKFKFVGGTNLLVPDLRTHFPQWNINLFNYQPLSGCVLLGVGAGAGAEGPINWYTKFIYQHLLNRTLYHSVRDERSKQYVERLGLKAYNTGCVSMWMLSPSFCKSIPTDKSARVVFTLTTHQKVDSRDQHIIDTLLRNYKDVFFWPQGINDYEYLHKFRGIEKIQILSASKEAFNDYLNQNETDYVGTRLHGGVYAMRHKRRAIIIAIDERARAINARNNINCVDINSIIELDKKINSSFFTNVKMDFDAIQCWKSQFGL